MACIFNAELHYDIRFENTTWLRQFLKTFAGSEMALFSTVCESMTKTKACHTLVRFSCATLRCVTRRQDMISILPMFYFGCCETVLLLAVFDPSFIVRKINISHNTILSKLRLDAS